MARPERPTRNRGEVLAAEFGTEPPCQLSFLYANAR